MAQATHRTYGSWIFGSVLLIFFFAVFWLAPETLPPFKQQILAITAALLAGLFGFFLTGDISLAMNHKESSTKLQAAGGIALFVVVLGWWNSSAAPVSTTAETPQAETSTSAPANSGIDVKGDADIRTSDDANTTLQTGNGQIQQGAQVNGTVEETAAPQGNSGINVGGNLTLESSGNGKTTLQTGNGQIQQTE